ncbi:cytochrome c biogenesis heme-transporting ATPase CcmA [Ramlibacter sp. G-1-2-2]|uniref:Cytochrome c biogenesis heme-transporting ATPase CcmA n=1 Tax=Ramlibacter agri TaxID=2728837 RepID=A0A848HB43_9BURK|nr:cytochrome c biogenesis heme-transporting ATPase CcmA [Ramlibacter agri]NML45693.1 cytochrome c biogenesis heme-transporting ATPase CcmA [Ramlibacter agri]
MRGPAEANAPVPAAGQGLAACGLSLHRGGRQLLAGLDLALGPGELLQVCGANGSGKTSLLRVLAGLLAPAAGTLSWQLLPVRGGDARYQRCIGYLGHADGLSADLDAFENLAYAQRLAGARPDRAEALRALRDFGVDEAGGTPLRRLSQGQRRRIALARLVLLARPLWLLDEPLAALDAAATACFTSQLATHLRAGGLAVVATHQLLDLRSRVLQLEG